MRIRRGDSPLWWRGSYAELGRELRHVVRDLGVARDGLADALLRRHHGRVVPLVELARDLLERLAGEKAAQVHGDLARQRDLLLPALARQLGPREVVVLGHLFLDALDGGLVAGGG